MIINKNIALALILGSGIDLSEDIISGKKVIFEETKGVHHKLVYTGMVAGSEVIVFKGRKHFYEGYSHEEITSNIKTAKEHGAKNILITNAAGGLNENFSEGDMMLITSHINFIDKLSLHPVSGSYSKPMQEKFRAACSKANVRLQEGVYGCYTGPTYETKAEIRFQKKIGLDAAGMSTVPEVNNANYNGMNVIGVSIITNLLKENTVTIAAHEDVLTTSKTASIQLNKVIPAFISELNYC